MPWTYEQSFDALTDGDLNGQDSWSGNAAYDVQGSVYYGASGKAVSVSGIDGTRIDRTLPAEIPAGSLYIAMRRTATGGGHLTIQLREDSTSRIFVRLGSSGNIEYYNNTSYVTLGAWSVDTWHPLNVEFDDAAQPNSFRVRMHNGASWGSFSSWVSVNGGGFGSIHLLRLELDGNMTGTGYFDAISASDITAGGAPVGHPAMRRWGGIPHVGGRSFGRGGSW